MMIQRYVLLPVRAYVRHTQSQLTLNGGKDLFVGAAPLDVYAG